MKKIILTLVVALFATVGYSQEWNSLKNFSPIMFESPTGFADTITIDTSSMYDVVGNYLVIDTTSDGRYFFDTTSVLTTDSSYILSAISDTADDVRDSIFWEAAGLDWITQKDNSRQIYIGDPTGVALKSVFYVDGQYSSSVSSINITGGGSVNAESTNKILVTGTGAVSDIANLDVGSELILISTGGAAMTLDSTTFAGNSQTLHVSHPSTGSGTVVLNGYDVLVLICTADDEFIQISFDDK